ncbi:MAG: adenosylcobinamide amidohydrolase [Eubacteriales bacterium]|nr:adenosylcobinamide amidohydrolase [Eubacteriales bacterium]
MMQIHTLPVGDRVYRYRKCVVVPFTGKRRVLSTCPLNGGYREDLTSVFNNDGNPGAGMACTLRAPTYEEHMALIAEEIGLDPQTAAGMSTAASMENVAICTEEFKETVVTAVVTGGIEVNGGRVGDPASWHEVAGKAQEVKQGTINIMLFINTDLSKGALTRAVVTCTEAKTAAIQELLAPSRYSMGLATGSGTDGTIVVCNADSDVCLTNAGKHSKLGELIGKAVKAAVKEALNKQSGLCPERQHYVDQRVDRFGITEQTLWEEFCRTSEGLTRAEFSECWYQAASRGDLVVSVSLYAHLLDQLMWGMVTPDEAKQMGAKLTGIMLGQHREQPEPAVGAEETLAWMIQDLKETLVKCITI